MPRLALTDLSVRSLKADQRTDFWDQKLPSFGVRVGPRSKTFIVKVGAGRRSLGAYPSVSLQDARRRAMALKSAGTSQKAHQTTFHEAYEAFKTFHCASKRPGTRKEYLRILDTQFLSKFKSRPLSEIGSKDINKITDELVDRPSEQAHTISLARIFFNFCVRRDYIIRSPIAGARVAVSTPRDRVLSDSELQCIWQACELPGEESGIELRTSEAAPRKDSEELNPPRQLINPTFAAIVKLLLLTGCRKSEIANLRKSWISSSPSGSGQQTPQSKLANRKSQSGGLALPGSITIPRGFTKNGREFTTPIGALAWNIVSAASSSTQGELLFPARASSMCAVSPTPVNGFSKNKAALDKALGPDFKPWTLHDLRRTFASTHAQLGTPIHITEKLLNHVSGTFSGVVGVYQRYSFWDEMVEAVDKYDHFIQSQIARS